MAKRTSLGKPITTAQRPAETRLESERMHDVLLLLEHLVRNEETTVKLILDCLYDVGSVNLINQKLRSRTLNCLMKWIAKLSKPVFRIIALRWLKKNCPQLLTNWLYSKVKFDKLKTKRRVIPTAPQEIQPTTLAKLENYNREILRLHSQVKRLTVLLIGVTITLGSATAWSIWNSQANQAQPSSPIRAAIVGTSAASLSRSTTNCNP
jgi:hypothetical protein